MRRTGNVGQGLALVLAKDNEVHGVARFQDMKKWEWMKKAGINLIRKDILTNPINDVPTDFDIVFNQAVVWKDWAKSVRINVGFAADLMMHFRESGAKMILGSTGGVYGSTSSTSAPFPAEDSPLNFSGVYRGTKASMEITCQWLASRFNIPTVILRYYYPVCPWQRENGYVGPVVQQLLDGSVETKLNPGAFYHLTDIADTVNWSIQAVSYANSPCEIFNVGNPQLVNVQQIIQCASELLGKKVEPEKEDKSADSCLGDFSKAIHLWGKPRFELQQMVKRNYRAIREKSEHAEEWMFKHGENIL